MGKKKEITTNYAQAWQEFKKSDQYKELRSALAAKRIDAPYSDNILQLAFNAGWNATGSVIKIVAK